MGPCLSFTEIVISPRPFAETAPGIAPAEGRSSQGAGGPGPPAIHRFSILLQPQRRLACLCRHARRLKSCLLPRWGASILLEGLFVCLVASLHRESPERAKSFLAFRNDYPGLRLQGALNLLPAPSPGADFG